MNANQCRAARGFKNWTMTALAEKAGVSVSSVLRFERGIQSRVKAIPQMMRQTFEREGIVFLGDHGIDSVDNML